MQKGGKEEIIEWSYSKKLYERQTTIITFNQNAIP